MMDNKKKEQIVLELVKLAQKESQAKVALRAGISSATMSQMVNGKWNLIRDEMWRKVVNTLHLNINWNFAPITNAFQLQQYLKAAQERSMSVAISYHAGSGKSFTYQKYARENDEVIYIECKNYWSKKTYMEELCIAAGLSAEGRVIDLIQRIIDHVRGMSQPLIIIDQADKLKDSSLDLFMDFYNELDGVCGIVLSGVPAFKKRILRGCQLDKIGYKELYSRIGSRFIGLSPVKEKDVELICKANGLDDELEISSIYNDSISDDFKTVDLRRVRRNIDKYFLNLERKSA